MAWCPGAARLKCRLLTATIAATLSCAALAAREAGGRTSAAVGGSGGQSRPAVQTERRPLTIERVTALPSLIGTAPAGPEWSHDSKALAFLWNDQGMPFRDVWLLDPGATAPRRLTDMGRLAPPPAPGELERIDALAQQAAARAHLGVTEVVWTADDEALIFIYRGELFRIRADGGGLTRLTTSGAGKRAVATSPDGGFISFLHAGDLWLWHRKTNDLVRATQVAGPPIGPSPGTQSSGMEFTAYAWSPDSRYVALQFADRRQVRTIAIPDYLAAETRVNVVRKPYAGDDRDVRRLGIYSVAEGVVRLLDLSDSTLRRINRFEWSPDGQRLLIDQSSDDGTDRWLYVVRPEDRVPQEIWHDQRPTRIRNLGYASLWHSDGGGIVFRADLDDRYRLYSLRLDSRAPVALTEGDWDVEGIPLRRAGEIFFVSNQKNPAERHVYRMPERGGTVTPLTSDAGHHVPTVAPDGSKIADLHSNDMTPTELYIVDAKSGASARRITHSPPEEFAVYPWVRPRYVTFKSRADGALLHGRVFEPPTLDRSKKYPVVLGPVYWNTVRNAWGSTPYNGVLGTVVQYMVLEKQYIVLQVDPRGSDGYGLTFREAALGWSFGLDIDDLHSGVEYLETLPYVDAERIGIWGQSYGGMLTLESLFRKPGVYKVGVASSPASYVPHFGCCTDISRRPSVRPDIFREASAQTYAEGLQDHLLLIHGMQDDNIAFQDTVMLVEKLMLLGKEFEVAIAPGASHFWYETDYYATVLLRQMVQFFDRYFGPAPRATRTG